MEELSPLEDLGHGDGSEDETEEDDEPKICQVCGDKSTGYHFNAMTCEGCKGFFRRAMKRPAQLCCPFQNACVITKSNRRQCQSCRLQKCLSIGMKREQPVTLTTEQETVVQELLAAHQKTFDMTCTQFLDFRPLDRDHTDSLENNPDLTSGWMSDSSDDAVQRVFTSLSYSRKQNVEIKDKKQMESNAFTSLPHFTDLTTYMIKNVINFSKTLAMFRTLIIEDQISLLKGATFEIILIHFNMFFNEVTGIWECGPLQYCMDDAFRAGFQHHLLDPLMNFHYTLRKLRLCEEDLLYPKIMACLTEMRSMNEEYTKQVLKIQDMQHEVSPLWLEIISKDS
ncbi:hypothetical protein DNTS_028777 [Danionella cerebrum]|nr:hypothetical protein DNTS_028777 [Danionella translucida]TRY86693.1 hypothetical protein DNTS_028777 [Danionella translucida]